MVLTCGSYVWKVTTELATRSKLWRRLNMQRSGTSTGCCHGGNVAGVKHRMLCRASYGDFPSVCYMALKWLAFNPIGHHHLEFPNCFNTVPLTICYGFALANISRNRLVHLDLQGRRPFGVQEGGVNASVVYVWAHQRQLGADSSAPVMTALLFEMDVHW